MWSGGGRRKELLARTELPQWGFPLLSCVLLDPLCCRMEAEGLELLRSSQSPSGEGTRVAGVAPCPVSLTACPL